ncbi:MAG: hypothetical protein ACPGMR_14785 [Pontibacterium sp.]
MFKFALPFLNRKSEPKGLASLALTDDGIALAYVNSANGEPVLEQCAFYDTAEPLSSHNEIHQLVAKLKLEGTPTVIVLPQPSYQLLLVDAPDVPANEIPEALRWRVKDLVSFDIETARIDYVELPEDAYRSRSDMMYAVVAEESYLKRLAEFTEAVGLEPYAIDIPELVLLNLMAPIAQDETGQGLFLTSSPSSSINLLSSQALYFTRSLSYDVKQAVFNPSMTAASSVLELQRSLDYYESQVGKPPCVKLHVLPMQEEDSPLLTELSNSLPLEVVSVDLNELIQVKPELDLNLSLQQQCLLAVMGAFRPVASE